MARSSEDTTGDWVTVTLGDEGWQARCRLEPRRGLPTIVELHVSSDDGRPERGIDVSLLRRLRLRDVRAELARQRRSGEKEPRDVPVAPDSYDDLLAMVAITYEEHVTAGSPHPDRDVWEFLMQLHETSHAEDWPWGESTRVRKYTRSGVRTLIMKAKDRGYVDLAQQSATATMRAASERAGAYDEGKLEMEEWRAEQAAKG